MEGPLVRTSTMFRQAARWWGLPIAIAALLFVTAMTGAATGKLAPPTGDVLLVVTGKITNTNVGQEARFDRTLFESLGMTTIVTRTAWHKEGAEFKGVLARRLMHAVGATGETVTGVAANDYRVTIPMTDFTTYDVLLATQIDGKELRLRTKGPIWLIYPEGVDLPPPLRQERMIWQLITLHVE